MGHSDRHLTVKRCGRLAAEAKEQFAWINALGQPVEALAETRKPRLEVAQEWTPPHPTCPAKAPTRLVTCRSTGTPSFDPRCGASCSWNCGRCPDRQGENSVASMGLTSTGRVTCATG